MMNDWITFHSALPKIGERIEINFSEEAVPLGAVTKIEDCDSYVKLFVDSKHGLAFALKSAEWRKAE